MNAVRSGFKSRAEVVSELGYDVEEIDAEIAADNARAKKMGLDFDTIPTNLQEKNINDDAEIDE